MKNEECERLKNSITDINPKGIVDGVINYEKFFNLKDKPKILWILKEANSPEDEAWDYQSLLRIDNLKSKQELLSIISIKRVIYTSYGLLNGFKQWADFPNIKNEEVYSSAEEIAYININKMPAGSTSDDNLIYSAYERYKDVISKQIKVYDPDILIFGNTLKYLFDDLDLNNNEKKYYDEKTGNTTYFKKNNKLYIHAWHPGKWTTKEEVYCNEIINTAKKWWSERYFANT